MTGKTSIQIAQTNDAYNPKLMFILITSSGTVTLTKDDLCDLVLQGTSCLRYDSIDEVFEKAS